MKKTVKAGVLTGLILAPGAVVSANGTGVVDDAQQYETTAVEVPYNAVADLDIRKERLEEIYGLNGTSKITNFKVYYDLLDELLPGGDTEGNLYEADYTLLEAKIKFLEELEKLKTQAASLSSEIALLKNTNPNLFSVVPLLEGKYNDLRSDFLTARSTLDQVVRTTPSSPSSYKLDPNLETIALEGVDSYFKTIEGFEGQVLKNVATLKSYMEDIKKPKIFISGGEITALKTSGDTATVGTGNDSNTPVTTRDTVTITVPAYVEQLAAMDEFDKNDADAPSNFKELYKEAIKFYDEKLNANEKKIADSHVLDDTRAVATVLKAIKDDITKADKVNALIAEIKVMNEADFKKKVETVVKEYDKLNPRQRALVIDYDSIIEGKDGTDGYKDVLDIINTINDLKTRKNTEEYRKLAKDTNDSYLALDDTKDLKRFVSNYDILKAIIDDLKVVKEGFKKTDSKGVETTYPSIEELIAKISSLEDIKAARDLYDSLTKDQQKLVLNYKELQGWEKFGKATIKVDDQIDSIIIENKKTFAAKVDSVNKNYDKLSENEKKLVTNYSRLEYLNPFANVTSKYYALKTTTSTYEDDVRSLLKTLDPLLGTELNTAYNDASANTEDQEALQKLRGELFASVKKLESQLDNAEGVITLISKANDDLNFANNNEKLLAIQAARDAYNNLPKEEQKLVKNLKTLTELEKVIKQPAAVIKSIEAVDPENISKFPSTAKSAVTAFEKLTATQKSYLSTENINRIEDFKTYLAFVEQMKALKPSAAGFQQAYNAAKAKYDELIQSGAWKSTPTLAGKIVEAVKTYGPTLIGHNTSITGGQGVQKMIEELGKLHGQDFLTELNKIDAAYAVLSADAKKQVTNYKQFQEMKKDGTAALKVVDLINDDSIYNVNVADSGYVKKVESAVKAFEKLTSRQKAYVDNDVYLERNLPIYEIVKAINNLKPSAKTYIEDIAAVRQMYDRLSTANKQYLAPILYKIEGAETGLVTVNEVMDLIDAARPGVEDYVQKLTAAREAYDKLARINSGYQKLVLNYKTLTEREKALKPVTTAIYQIKELEEILARPVIDSNELVKKYNDAVKAYEKIPYESRELVYNRESLLSTLYPVAKTMEAIANIKPSSKTFAEDVKKARDWYNSLSPADQARVSNYNDLLAYENTVGGGAVVDDKIRQLPSTPPTQYMQAIKEARAAYDALTANEKRAVTLYKELQNYEKGVKNVQATIDAIDNLQYASNLVSAYDKATKALDKLTAEQRQMVPNMDKLRSVGPAIDVYKMIAALKPSNANYAGSVQAAYSAYNMLSSTEKQYVTNFGTLQEAKNNVDSVQAVISKISSISPTSRNYAEQVAEALAMYNSLPSAVRKQVTNFDVLKSSQKEADTVDKVRQLISEINPSTSNFASKVKSARSAYDKLTTQQKRLVSNYFLLEDYEAQLGGSTLFF